jgi:hypothetical protein
LAIVYVQFPKTGLGNLLLIWARARVFSKIHDLPLVTSSWWGIRWGAWLRREQKKRVYWGCFNETSYCERLKAVISLKTSKVIAEPPLTKTPSFKTQKKILFLFRDVVTSSDLFDGLREQRDFLKEEILQLLKPELKNKLDHYPIPVISVHIRRGDFKIANPITPLSFFIDAVRQIRKSVGAEWPVTVFTDAESHEITDMLKEPGVVLAAPKPDILDILLMSKSKAIVLSQSSTFSYWSAFLSEAIIIMNDNDWQERLMNKGYQKEFRINTHNKDAYQALIGFLERNREVL